MSTDRGGCRMIQSVSIALFSEHAAVVAQLSFKFPGA
jgi:hypothetical protein